MATFLEHAYSVVHQDNTADQPTLGELKTQLEKGNDDIKVETMYVNERRKICRRTHPIYGKIGANR